MTRPRISTSPFQPGSKAFGRLGTAFCLTLGLGVVGGIAAAQQAPDAGPHVTKAPAETPVQSPFVMVDQEALFLKSQFGKRIQADLERQRSELAAENREIGDQLIAEEQALTEQRKTLSAQAFAPLAKTFDTKVQQIRSEQESKSLAIQQRLDSERQTFLQRLGPILADLMRERGAVALIDRKAVLLAVDDVDITDEAIVAMDERLGSGLSPDLSGTTQDTANPEPAPGGN